MFYCQTVAIQTETERERENRRYRRTLFDGVAELYDTSRRGYPSQIVEVAATTAGLHPGSAVLEVGCGTGQLTESLARLGVDLTAIDIGPSMVQAAGRRLADCGVCFKTASFEEFAAPEGSFDLIISGTAFHWIDPEVKFSKSLRLLRPGGWLALLTTSERYDDPFGAALRDMWVARSEDGGSWLKRPAPSNAELITSSGLFEWPVRSTDHERITLPVETVIGVENTRATSLSWSKDARERFTEEMRRHLRYQPEVHLTQVTSLTMARAGINANMSSRD